MVSNIHMSGLNPHHDRSLKETTRRVSNVSVFILIIYPIILHWGICVAQTSVSFLSKELDRSVFSLSLSLSSKGLFTPSQCWVNVVVKLAILLLLKLMELLLNELQIHSAVNLYVHCFQWDQYPQRWLCVDVGAWCKGDLSWVKSDCGFRICFKGGYLRKAIPVACKYTIFPVEGPPSTWFSCLKNIQSREKDIILEFHLEMTLTLWHWRNLR